MQAIDLWLLVFPGFVLLDATGPAQVFSTANDEARDAGLPEPYRINMISPDGGLVSSTAGVALQTLPLPDPLTLAVATLIVAGGRGLENGASPALAPALVDWVGQAATGTARCCAVCTGAFVLARAGLLDGRRAVTHWQDAAALQAQYPAISVQEDAIYIRDGAVYTSAGIAAGIDLALALVEADLGRTIGLAVAKRLVVFHKRPGGQRQFSSELLAQADPQGLHGQLCAWLRPRLQQQLDVEQMAAALAMSVRTLHRRLQQEAGLSPAQLLLRLRMETACALLERPGMTVKRAAHQSGFGSEYNLRRAFAAQLGVAPSDYLARFG
ncbi:MULTISPECIES: GlxA family transcriptional regulator [unclassified Duganella]|uniref:GlxA family transcriptional regulator n=1 Tax=unclassified Duganella TaxID=2636909 RepID=UPI000889C3AE|nr:MULTISPECIES: helix-turn-helix domain-containing protein [unclassified Duganella]SDH23224.1 Transcriptional regulator GlxA family, contains an amidase domain and an AraC-type DNA-binding HTH domain [Duganella sp. OV458]SDK45306.1 Transcriptional regulator GlxA family, contains an amidase domain and an AraC-type DNA-binding HTH domain [Duganella sp. OV510]